jgi:hypothetical protein
MARGDADRDRDLCALADRLWLRRRLGERTALGALHLSIQ